MAFVYKIINPKGRVYIGSTINIKSRFNSYKLLHCKTQTRLYASFLKYGVNAHKFEIITECTEDEMYKMEAVYGHMYDVLGSKGLNCKLPDHGSNYRAISEETREKMSKVRLGIKFSDNHRRKLSETRKLKFLNIPKKQKPEKEKYKMPEHRKEYLRQKRTGSKLSEEHKKKIIDSLKGNKRSAGHKNNVNIVIDLNTGIFYDCAKDAYEANNFPFSLGHFNSALSGRKKNKTSFVKA